MAVFTPVSIDDLRDVASTYSFGKILSIRGISSGIENSNFFVATEQGEIVLTLFEKLSEKELPFYLNLMQHLDKKGIKVAGPIANQQGKILHVINNKPATFVKKLEGGCLIHPNPNHCAQVGEMMAKMHLAGADYALEQPNLRGLSWWQETVPVVHKYLPVKASLMLQNELRHQEDFAESPLYWKLFRGPIHADLFRNNVMFHQDLLTGFFDFYFAGCDLWLFDVAVAINDWCIDLETGEFDNKRVRAFLDAYNSKRSFTVEEEGCWQSVLRAASLRFWVSRLYDFYQPRQAEMLKPHDPTHFERILRLRIEKKPPELIA